MANGILDALMANPRGWGPAGPAFPDDGPPQQPQPMTPGMAASKLIGGALQTEPPHLADPSIMGQAALGMAGRYPRLLAAVMGLTSPVPASSGDLDKKGIVDMQTALKAAGYYTGPIDGVMGGGTQEANTRYQKDQAAKEQLDIQRQQSQAALEGAKAAQGETARKAQEAQAETQKQQEGQERFRQIESEVPGYEQFFREYAPIAGTTLGIGLGAGSKIGVNKVADALSAKAAGAADAIMGRDAGDLPGRVANVNQFWAQGQKPLPFMTPEAPFTAAPTKKMGFAPNAAAPEASALYQPSTLRNVATDLGVTGAFGTEYGLGHSVLLPEAQAQLDKAHEAVSKDPSDINIQAYESAKDRVAFYEGLSNIGRGAAMSYLPTGIKYGRDPSRPDVAAAEAERIRIGQELKGKPNVAAALMGAPTKTGRMKTVAPGVRQSQAGTYHADDGRFVSPPDTE